MNNQLHEFISNCIELYAEFQHDHYVISLSHLPDLVQYQFSALIAEEDEDLAVESIGPDNPLWDKKMFPALLRYLKNASDKDEAIEFQNAWLSGVNDYMKNRMKRLLSEAIDEYNQDQGFVIKDHYDYFGVSRQNFGAQS